MHRRTVVRVTTLLALLLTLAIALPGAASPVAAAGSTINPEAQKVLDVARKQRGDPWVSGSVGPAAFDCSGLVYYAFKQAGLLKRIGGSRRSARGYWDWFADRGRASRTNPRPGDLAIWGNGRHIGIYLGNGKAISAINDGVTIHKVKALTDPFTVYLHVKWKKPALEGMKR
jgi:cell wall-associated NlpC family hydrolase